jgi:uncharacterized membrane protein YjfL (UPF0719 family)
MNLLIIAVFMIGFGSIVGLASFLELRDNWRQGFQAISFALVSLGSMFGFEHVLKQAGEEVLALVTLVVFPSFAIIVLILAYIGGTPVRSSNADDDPHPANADDASPEDEGIDRG